MNKICKNCGGGFEVASEDLGFLERVAPVIGAKKFEVPGPTHCYKCRLQRRFSWRNDINLYRRKCDKTGVNLISMFSASAS